MQKRHYIESLDNSTAEHEPLEIVALQETVDGIVSVYRIQRLALHDSVTVTHFLNQELPEFSFSIESSPTRWGYTVNENTLLMISTWTNRTTVTLMKYIDAERVVIDLLMEIPKQTTVCDFLVTENLLALGFELKVGIYQITHRCEWIKDINIISKPRYMVLYDTDQLIIGNTKTCDMVSMSFGKAIYPLQLMRVNGNPVFIQNGKRIIWTYREPADGYRRERYRMIIASNRLEEKHYNHTKTSILLPAKEYSYLVFGTQLHLWCPTTCELRTYDLKIDEAMPSEVDRKLSEAIVNLSWLSVIGSVKDIFCRLPAQKPHDWKYQYYHMSSNLKSSIAQYVHERFTTTIHHCAEFSNSSLINVDQLLTEIMSGIHFDWQTEDK